MLSRGGLGLLLAFGLVACDADAVSPYSDEEIAYFAEIAFGTEYGVPGDTLLVRKWRGDVRVRISGVPSQRQIETVHSVGRELDEIGADLAILERGSDADWNAEILFVTHDSMVSLLGDIAEGHQGFFRYWSNEYGEIYRGLAIIAYDRGSETRLDHAVREELTQMLGLGQDSWSYEESIFYQGYSEVTEFLSIDRSVIRMLYDRRLSPGMSRMEALRILADD